EVLLKEAWKRYKKPMAITEVHLHCHREEQLRWFNYVWKTCCGLAAKGIDIKAVTSWGLLGSFGWNKLLTQPRGEYEPGVFRSEVLLKEAWKRYKKPMAITEVHLHCHREEQLRWFNYVWKTCCGLAAKGIDIKAVTSWGLLGSFGWNKLLTQPRGEYEPGVF